MGYDNRMTTMEKLINGLLVIPIGFAYNAFFYQLANSLFRNLPFDDRRKKAITVLIVAAIVGISLSQQVIDNFNYTVGKGVKTGGYILMTTTFINFWSYMGDDLKLAASGAGLSLFLWCGKKWGKQSEEPVMEPPRPVPKKQTLVKRVRRLSRGPRSQGSRSRGTRSRKSKPCRRKRRPIRASLDEVLMDDKPIIL